MQFVVVESSPGFLEPVVVTGAAAGGIACRRLTGERVSAKFEKIVHAGETGDDHRPAALFQWCPLWLAARMRAAGVVPEARRIAANPKEGPTEGFQYQSGENKWTPRARRDRWKEQGVYRQHVRPDGRWSALSANHIFGYHRVQAFIESYRRREIVPEAFFWCMIFAALTASESTKTAEANLAGFAKVLVARRAMDYPFDDRLISFEDFRREGSGFQEQRYVILQKIIAAFPRLEAFLAKTALQDRALRRAIALDPSLETPGLGITKMSFALECYGQDVACLDRWMLRALGLHEKVSGRYAPRHEATRAGGPENERAHVNRALDAHRTFWKGRSFAGGAQDPEVFRHVAPPPWPPFSDGAYVMSGYGADRFSRVNANVLAEYEHYEDALRRTEYYRYALDERAPNPLCRAQWTMWEDVLRHHPDPKTRLPIATHSPLFFVIEGEGPAKRRMRRAELLREDAILEKRRKKRA